MDDNPGMFTSNQNMTPTDPKKGTLRSPTTNRSQTKSHNLTKTGTKVKGSPTKLSHIAITPKNTISTKDPTTTKKKKAITMKKAADTMSSKNLTTQHRRRNKLKRICQRRKRMSSLKKRVRLKI